MSLIDSDSLNLDERFLNLVSYRQSLVAGNIANLDTPGYKTHDIDFHAEMRRAMSAPEAPSTPMAKEVPGLMQRPDGNDVSIDRESMALAEVQMQYRVGVELVRHEVRMVNMALKDGATS
jgi:flagellar basal-body rod protein FlgB